MPDIALRPITADDAHGLMALWRETWTATYGPSLGPDALTAMLAALDETGITSMLPGKDERGYCAVSEGQVVGSIIFAERGGTAYFWGMYIRPDHQRRGLGSRLLAALAENATARRIEVRAMLTSPWAIGFYQKHGFRHIGEEHTESMSGTIKTLVMSVDLADVLQVSQTARAPS